MPFHSFAPRFSTFTVIFVPFFGWLVIVRSL